MAANVPTIYVVGAGVDPVRHLTIEAIEVLGECKEIWTNVPIDVFRRLPEALRLAIRSLKPFYKENRLRQQNYADVTQHILARAGELGVVGYLTHGHPIVFDSVAMSLYHVGTTGSIKVNLINGISCIDTVLLDVHFNPGGGLQIFEATRFVRDKLEFDTRAALLLLQLSVFGMSTPRLTANAPPSNLKTLRDALLAHYPADHAAVFVRSAASFNSPFMVSVKIGGLDMVAPSATLASSLFIAPLRERPAIQEPDRPVMLEPVREHNDHLA
jgi:uncharacterized protein YabN with tetrapyrrole methylase and pyrophosphatase domain